MSDETADRESSRILSLESLHQKIDALGGGGSERKQEEQVNPGSVQEQVDRAVARASEREKAKTAREKEKADLEARFEKIEKLAERPPISIRRLTKMFWGEP